MANRKQFDAAEVANGLVAKYVTGRTTLSAQWRNLYDFAEYCLTLGYEAGKKAGRASSKKEMRAAAKTLELYEKQLLARHKTEPLKSPPMFLLNSVIIKLRGGQL